MSKNIFWTLEDIRLGDVIQSSSQVIFGTGLDYKSNVDTFLFMCVYICTIYGIILKQFFVYLWAA